MKVSPKRLQLFHNRKLKKRKRWNDYKLKKNKSKLFSKKNNLYTNRRERKKLNWTDSKKEITLFLPKNFILNEYTNIVLEFINNIEIAVRRFKPRSIQFRLDEVVNIDIGAIVLFLSKINALSARDIKAWGNFPKNEDCKKTICESGFLSTMRDMTSKKRFFKPNNNLIVNRGFQKTDNEALGSSISKIVKYLTGEIGPYQPLYTLSQEICANSVEHANKENHKKNWLYSISYKKDSVIFTLIDIGEGILKTVKRKTSQIFDDMFKDEIEVLSSLFDGKYQSRTGDRNRYKGLPKIKRIVSNGYIDELIIITNKVFLDFNNIEQSKCLSNELKGTYYCCTISKKSIEKWRKRLD